MFTVSFYRLIDLCFLFVLLDILCRAFEWIGMIWYKLIHRFAKLEQQFSNTSRFAKRKRQNQTKDDKSTFFPDVLSRCSLQTKGLQTWKTNRDMLFLLCVPRQSAHFGEDVLFPLLQQSSHVCRSAPFLFIYIYIACIYFGFWFSIFGLTSTKRVFEHVSQRIKGPLNPKVRISPQKIWETHPNGWCRTEPPRERFRPCSCSVPHLICLHYWRVCIIYILWIYYG